MLNRMMFLSTNTSESYSSGGTITYDGDYKIHTFTSNGIFRSSVNADASILVVGGGGNGRSYNVTSGGGAVAR